jgi:hypothetical protein
MGQTTTEPDTNEILLNLLKRTAEAHGVHEKEIGKPDPDWPQWYAAYMTRTLREKGYRLTQAGTPPSPGSSNS